MNPATLQLVLQLILTLMCGLLTSYTAKVVAEIKVWILTQEAVQREKNDLRYVTKETFQAFREEYARSGNRPAHATGE